jgi:uracil-DNA glycosylase
MSGLSREEALAALHWLVEAGADETISDEPINRIIAAAPRPAETRPAAPPVPDAASLTPARPVAASPSGIQEGSALAQIAERLAASCHTLSELKSVLATFDGCELKRHASNLVFADGNPAAGIMFIGEAPGADEDRQGLPFVGRAGQLLDRMLASIGLNRQKAYITNIVNWRPPGNREPTPEEAAICLPFLHRHIELASPKLLVLLGAVPVRHLVGIQGILRSRGRWETYRLHASEREVPVMLTLHPAYLLRQPAAKRLAWKDFLIIADKLKSLGLA